MSGRDVTLDRYATRSGAMSEATADVGDVLEEKIVLLIRDDFIEAVVD